MPKTVAVNRLIGLDAQQTGNGGEETVNLIKPYRALLSLVGTSPILFHRWDWEAVQEKADAAKGSKAKKTDNIESYVYRNDEGYLGIAGDNFVRCIQEAGRYEADPRSPRKSLRDLLKAAVLPLDTTAIFTPKRKEWDYEDHRRCMIQRNGVTRVRPAMKEGWEIAFSVLVTLPQYIPSQSLLKLANSAGAIIGLCDHRPTYGRFAVKAFEVL